MLKRAACRWQVFVGMVQYERWADYPVAWKQHYGANGCCWWCKEAIDYDFRASNTKIQICVSCYCKFLRICTLFPGEPTLQDIFCTGCSICVALIQLCGGTIEHITSRSRLICSACCGTNYAVNTIRRGGYEYIVCPECTTKISDLSTDIDRKTIGHAALCVEAVKNTSCNKDVVYYLSKWFAKVMFSDRAIMDAYYAR